MRKDVFISMLTFIVTSTTIYGKYVVSNYVNLLPFCSNEIGVSYTWNVGITLITIIHLRMWGHEDIYVTYL